MPPIGFEIRAIENRINSIKDPVLKNVVWDLHNEFSKLYFIEYVGWLTTICLGIIIPTVIIEALSIPTGAWFTILAAILCIISVVVSYILINVIASNFVTRINRNIRTLLAQTERKEECLDILQSANPWIRSFVTPYRHKPSP